MNTERMSLIHLEHALPALAELGAEHLLGPMLSGNQEALQAALAPEAIGNLLRGLASGAERRAARRLLLVARATADELLAMEANPALEQEALRQAAKCSLAEVQAVVIGFISGSAPSPLATPASSGGASTSETNLEPVGASAAS